jgi:hypothetical protein
MPKAHQEFLTQAIEREAEGQRALLVGDAETARKGFIEAGELYQRSWEQAPPRSYGRLVGMLKSAVLSGASETIDGAAGYVRAALKHAPNVADSPTGSYALALAALIESDDGAAREWSAAMAGGSDAFERTARAIAALADRDRERYRAAVAEIVHDFEQRAQHLTGVAIADTALMLERLAAPRGLAAGLQSELLPA